MIKGVEGQRVIVDRSWRTMAFAKNARSQRSRKSISFLPAPADDIDPDATRRSKAPKSNEARRWLRNTQEGHDCSLFGRATSARTAEGYRTFHPSWYGGLQQVKSRRGLNGHPPSGEFSDDNQ